MSEGSHNTPQFWDSQAEIWGEKKPLGPFRPIVNEIVENAIFAHYVFHSLPEDATVLDLGSGPTTGEYPFPGNVKQRIALDISQKMLQYERHAKRVAANLAHPLPFADNSVDACQSVMVMRYLTQEQHVQLLREIWRVLKPGSLFFVADLTENNSLEVQVSTFSPEEWKTLAEKMGFSDISTWEGNLATDTPLGRELPQKWAEIALRFGYIMGVK